MNAVDTNVLIYAHDPRDPRKQAIATSLVGSLSDGALLWQVACEYLAASRKLEPYGYSLQQAFQDVRDPRATWSTILPSWDIMERSEALLQKYSLSCWDGLILAACIEAGVNSLYSEDFDAYPTLNGLSIINPFLPAV
jgi:predicted nucleic acid-binding protein